MSRLLFSLGRFCARHRLMVIAAWLLATVVISAGAQRAGSQTNDDADVAGSDSAQATALLERTLPDQATSTSPFVIQAPDGKLTDARYRDDVERIVAALERAPHVTSASDPLHGANEADRSADGRIGVIRVRTDLNTAELTKEIAEPIHAAASEAERGGLRVEAGGDVGRRLAREQPHTSEIVGLSTAVVVLLVVLGGAVAMMLPLVTALLALAIGLGAITLLSHAISVPDVAPTLGTMIGLGVGIDYALFLISRYREARQAGIDIPDAVGTAQATAGAAVLFAGATVVIALASLAVAGIAPVTGLGYTAAAVVAIAMLAATTLLPALLGLAGPRIDALAVRRNAAAAQARSTRRWERWARAVVRRRWIAASGSLVLLAVLAVPTLSLHLGQQDVGALSRETTARQAHDLNARAFGPGANGPLLVTTELERPAANDQQALEELQHDHASQQRQQREQAEQETAKLAEQLVATGVPPADAQTQAAEQIEAEQQRQAGSSDARQQQQTYERQERFLSSPASDPRLQQLRDDLANTAGVATVSQPSISDDATAAVLTVDATTAPSDRATEELVGTLRDHTLPRSTRDQQMTAHVGGTTAVQIDLAEQIAGQLPLIIAVVIGLSCVLLLVAFRSVVLPLKAAAMNLLSVGAAYGVLVAVFQWGWGAQLIGLDGPVPIVSFVPMLMFAILFGLSMDYEVFLLSRVQEHHDRGESDDDAIVHGLAATGRIITAAALIMVSVFASFLLTGDPLVKMFGIGLSAAIAIDATIVRCLLVPATMALFGRANWWCPRWLARLLPTIDLDGTHWRHNQPAAQREFHVPSSDGQGST